MGTPPEPRPSEPRRDTQPLRGRRRATRRAPRRSSPARRTFTATLAALEDLAESGARVAVHVRDLDRHTVVLEGDDFLTHPIGGLGVVPLLVEVAAGFQTGTLDPLEIIEREKLDRVSASGVWQHLKAPALPLGDLAVLAAATGDALAANALLDRVGLDAVRARIDAMDLTSLALLDKARDRRGPDDAPHFALGSARELAHVFSGLVNGKIVSAAVSAQVAEWLSLNHDLSLVGAATGLDPFSHEDDEHGLLFINKTGRDPGIRSEAGVLAGPRAGLSYAMIVCFDDLSIVHRLRAHEAFRTFGLELMEFVY